MVMDSFNIFRSLAVGTGIDYKFFNVRMNHAIQEKKSHTLATEKPSAISDISHSLEIPLEKSDSNRCKRKQSVEEEDEQPNIFGSANAVSLHKRKKKKLTKERLAQIKQEEKSHDSQDDLKDHSSQKEVTHFRRIHRIQVWGDDIPHPVENFAQLEMDYDLHPAVVNNIQRLGYASPTPIQMQVIPVLLHERQVLACAPTGSGKTAAFLIPIIQKLKATKKKGPRALIVAPTRELAKQLYNDCGRLSEGTDLCPFVLDKKAKKIKNELGTKFLKKCDILISTPKRLIYMLKQDEPMISLKRVKWLIIDESDKLFEAGKQGFRSQLAEIYKACDSASIKRAMFSATFSQDVEEWCKLNLDELITVSVGDRNTVVDTIQQEVVFTGDDKGKLYHFRDLIKQGFQPPVLVFVESKEQAKKLYKELMFDNIHVDTIHADRSLDEREKVIRDFRLGKVWILICTDILGRGIDFKGVNLVINYDLPSSAISYIHRIGRTGRAGRSGRAITYFNETDFPNLKKVFRGRLRKLLAAFEGGSKSISSAS